MPLLARQRVPFRLFAHRRRKPVISARALVFSQDKSKVRWQSKLAQKIAELGFAIHRLEEGVKV
jgi:hypothetical protein